MRSTRRCGTGPRARADNPIFYVSSSPWNLYEHLDEFLALHRIPAGPLLLRDWGLSRHGFAPGGGHSHKLDKIRGVLETFERLPFILIGDSGQEDAEHYRTIVREFPGRIRCVYIRNVPLTRRGGRRSWRSSRRTCGRRAASWWRWMTR